MSRPLGADLFAESPLSDLLLPALIPVGLSYAVTIPAFFTDTSLVPLALAVGMGIHWPIIGWLYGRPEFLVHALVRVAVVVTIWFAAPSAVFTALLLSVGFVYLATFVLLLVQVRRAESRAA